MYNREGGVHGGEVSVRARLVDQRERELVLLLRRHHLLSVCSSGFLSYGLWLGVWDLGFGALSSWFMVYGTYFVVCGLWFVVCGLRSGGFGLRDC